jgi:aryl-alcohol dehydrogenase-like predicted oxidoreductase
VRYKQLGKSGLLVSELALGTMIFGEEGARRADPDESVRMVHRFLDAGGNHIDTANVYAGGRSEEIVGRAIRDRRDQVVLATKVRFRTGEGPNDLGLSRLQIFRSVEASLRRLQTDAIDLLYMHCWDPVTPLEESLWAFDDLVRAGKLRYVGVSNFQAWQLMKALGLSDARGWARFVAAQYQYSLVMRDVEIEIAPLCLAEGVGIVPWSPLGGGFLSGKYQADKRPTSPEEGRLAGMGAEAEESWEHRANELNWRILDLVGEVAAEHGCTLAQVALAWLRAQPAVVSIILGARTMDQLEDNLGSLDCELTEKDLARLDEASAIEVGYPRRFIDVIGARSLD